MCGVEYIADIRLQDYLASGYELHRFRSIVLAGYWLFLLNSKHDTVNTLVEHISEWQSISNGHKAPSGSSACSAIWASRWWSNCGKLSGSGARAIKAQCPVGWLVVEHNGTVKLEVHDSAVGKKQTLKLPFQWDSSPNRAWGLWGVLVPQRRVGELISSGFFFYVAFGSDWPDRDIQDLLIGLFQRRGVWREPQLHEYVLSPCLGMTRCFCPGTADQRSAGLGIGCVSILRRSQTRLSSVNCWLIAVDQYRYGFKIGRASCRERV